jgi:hypothetical protein
MFSCCGLLYAKFDLSFTFSSFLLAPLKIRLGAPHGYIGHVDRVGGPFHLDEDLVEEYRAEVPFLEYSSKFRHQYSVAFAELFLLRSDAVVASYYSHTSIQDLRDPWKTVQASLVCPELDDPVEEIDHMSRLRALAFRDEYLLSGVIH